MKLLLLSDAASAHTIKWANGLSNYGCDVSIISLNNFGSSEYNPEIEIYVFNIASKLKHKSSGNYLKALYLLSIPFIKKQIKKINPDILHAFSLSSYGFIGTAANYHPYLVSVWGTDIYQFPEKNILTRKLTQYTLKRADMILSTSEAMKYQTMKFTSNKVSVINYGVDVNEFKPQPGGEKETFRIGTIKSLEKIYGIDFLIKAFKIILEKHPEKKTELIIIGKGTQKEELERLAAQLDLGERIKFIGYVSYSDISRYHNMLDVSVFPSLHESFGVSVIEAMACAKPIVATNNPGFNEIIENGFNGILVPPADAESLALAIEKFMIDESLRDTYSANARKTAEEKFNFSKNLSQLINCYELLLRNNKN
jgi:glycosyltransferase involved in cell wall biosynthesis